MLAFEFERTALVSRCLDKIPMDRLLPVFADWDWAEENGFYTADDFADWAMKNAPGVELYDLIELGGLQEWGPEIRRSVREAILWGAYKKWMHRKPCVYPAGHEID